ncbi:MAG TPA: biopolymer transporter ExbD [Gemmatimonadales bacterium]|jgi:biopolymer transport protein ExbD
MPLRADVNVTPMIDVMLVLLIIFMIVTPLLASHVALPQSTHADRRPEEPAEIVLVIDRNGVYALSTSGEPEALPADTLGARLAALYRDRKMDRILYLKADQALSFGPVQDVIEIARRSGVRVVAAVTEQRRRSEP